MDMKYLAFLILFSIQLQLSAQIQQGKVIDSESKPIPFVSMGLLSKNYGTISDEKGNFSLDLNRLNINDTIRISSIGYKYQDLTVEMIKSKIPLTIILQDSIYQIRQIDIKPNSVKNTVFGHRKTHKTYGFAFGGVGDGCEVANLYSNEELILPKEFKFHINFSNYDSIKFRLNFYSYQDSLPGRIINTIPIYITANIDKGWISKDLRQYDLMIDGDFVISIEPIQSWGFKDQTLKNKFQLIISGGIKNGNSISYSRIFSLGHWRKHKSFFDFYMTANK